jgi:hypothetical protein
MEAYAIRAYAMDGGAAPKPVRLDPVTHSWGSLALTGQSIHSGDAVTVALRWLSTPGFQTAARYASLVRLVDRQTNWILATASHLLLSDEFEPTDIWTPGVEATQYYVLPLYPGTPPIDVEVVVSLVDTATGQALDLRDPQGVPAGREVALGIVALGDAPAAWLYEDSRRPFVLTPVDSALLAAYSVDWPSVAPGGRVGLTLEWCVPPETLENVRLELRQGDTTLAFDDGPPLGGRAPAVVAPGKTWLDRRDLYVDGDASSGSADLVLIQDETQTVLGQIEVAGFQRLTEPPDVPEVFAATFGETIHLLGYRLDVPERLTSADTLMLTLYWQALADGVRDQEYAVTAQILDATGRLIGQHDGIPVNGMRPTSGWAAGEYLIDEHPMTFREPYSGSIQIQIALYDPANFVRLLTEDEQDSIHLPVTLTVEFGD